MAESLTSAFGIERDIVSVVGAGGKTTLVFTIGDEVRRGGRKVIVTTTTKMGSDQTGGLTVVPPDLDKVAGALAVSGACLVIAARDHRKATGVSPAWVDDAAAAGIAEVIVIEADGARRRKLKAPADHEPVIPQSSTLVIAVMAASAVGEVIADVAHRPDCVASIAGAAVTDRLTTGAAARVLTSDLGGRKSVPQHARFAIAVTGSSASDRSTAEAMAELVGPFPVTFVSREGPPTRL